jgi:hypothetical protein
VACGWQAVLLMLEREEHWIKWKANGCQAFDKAVASLREEGATRKRKSAGGVKKVSLGNSALTRLWNSAHSACVRSLAARVRIAVGSVSVWTCGLPCDARSNARACA